MKREELRIISGGQTGVDRAALDAAIEAGIEHGGWCPRGRRAEDGRIPEKYALQETDGTSYMLRTIKNVKDSDVTLLLFWRELSGGTLRTHSTCITLKRAYYEVNIAAAPELVAVDLHECIAPAIWREVRLAAPRPLVLNVAGPRASKHPLVYERAKQYMDALISELLR